jgi:O-acetyl-ADP-ribose deacetylase (regulator of RNase III)
MEKTFVYHITPIDNLTSIIKCNGIVNCVGIMGKGIALQFKQAYPDNFKAYEKACDHNEITTGKMFVYSTGALFGVKYIINFPTKKHWKENSKINYIREGLDDLIQVIKKNDIKSIALPPLGCGNGGLNWNEVKPIIFEKLSKLPDLQVFIYEPAGSPKAEEIKINENITDEDKIIQAIQSWNARKKMLFKKEHIEKALSKLRAVGMI